MSRNYYSEINLHITWHTKGSLPNLTPEVATLAHHHIRGKIINWPGAYIHAIGGTKNHVPVAVSVAPTIVISDFIGQLKGASSHEVNQKLGQGRKILEWQAGYGVVSFGTKDLAWVVDYVKRQKEHHRSGKVHDRLERIEPREAEEAEAEPREGP